MALSLGRLEVETPDHVVLRYDLAGAGNRGFAAILDVLIASLLTVGSFVLWSFLASALPASLRRPLEGLLLLSTALIGWAYFVVLEWLWNGQTVGKRLAGLRVITADGSPASFTAVLVRNLVRLADFLPAFYGLGVLVMILSPKSQRLGDLAAGTFVVRAPRPRVDWLSLRTVGRGEAGDRISIRPLPGEVQRLVREFVAREGSLAPADRARVAGLIASRVRSLVTAADAPADDAELLRSVARALRAEGGD
ncbi:MAG: RDD family protein [Solirubrobacteraceae bacterium]